MNALKIKSKCSSNVINYLEKYAYDKYNSKRNIIILCTILDIMFNDRYNHLLDKYKFVSLYMVILSLKKYDKVMFNGVDIYIPILSDLDNDSFENTYNLIYSFIYS